MRRASQTGSSSNAAPAWLRSGATAGGWGSRRRPWCGQGPVEEELTAELAGELGIGRGAIRDAQWADNGPGWIAVLLESAEAVLAIKPDLIRRDLGIVGPYPPDSECAFEVRAFFLVGDQVWRTRSPAA